MTYEITGIDISRYQGPWDFVKSIEAGISFAFIRAGGAYQNSGIPFTDYRFHENARKAADCGIPAGFYWYFVPNSDPLIQAVYFADLIKSEKWQLPPVADLEFAGGYTPLKITERVKIFVDKIEELIGVWPLIYSRSSWMHENLGPSTLWAMLELWIARYKPGIDQPWGNPGDPDSLDPPYFSTWRFWQYTEDAKATIYGGLGPPAGDDDVDLNYFNGNQAEFDQYIGASPTQPTNATIVKVTQSKNTVLRSEPKGTILAVALDGTHYQALDQRTDADGALWYYVGNAWILASHTTKVT